jgi:hypothetical protein
LKQCMLITYEGNFVENIRHNYVQGLPSYCEELLQNEFSPFRAFLDCTQPGVKVRLVVGLEVCDASTPPA